MNVLRKIFNYKSSFKLLLCFFQMLGLFSMKYNWDLKQWTFLLSKRNSILLVTVISISDLIWLISSLSYVLNLGENQYSLGSVIAVFRQTFSAIYHSVILMIFLIRRQQFAEIINDIMRIKDFSNHLNDKTDRFIEAALLKSIQLFFIFALLKIIGSSAHYLQDSDYFFAYQLVYEIIGLTASACIFHYAFSMLLLFQLFKIPNDSLMKIKTIITTNNYSEKIKDSQHVDLQELSMTVRELRDLFKLYLNLCELSMKISKFYSIPIFLGMFSVFFATLLLSYELIVIVLFTENMEMSLNGYIFFTCFDVMLIFQILTICWTPDLVINEVS